MNCIITGATKGIGKAILEKFAKEGANVAFCARNPTEVGETIKALNQDFPNIKIIGEAVDMSQREEVKAFGAKVLSEWDRVDVLVNNVGVYKAGWVTTEDEGTLEMQINTNLYSAYYMTRAVLSAMQPFQSGHIFNICSVASLEIYEDAHSYSVSKFAMLGFSKALRKELKTDGIKVTAILPGATWSAAWGNAPIPTERLSAAADIAQAIWSAYQLPPTAVVEEMIIRPQLGDL
jgi:NADP-dependent 3-hydroxy acid dehydrogenase YdfG